MIAEQFEDGLLQTQNEFLRQCHIRVLAKELIQGSLLKGGLPFVQLGLDSIKGSKAVACKHDVNALAQDWHLVENEGLSPEQSEDWRVQVALSRILRHWRCRLVPAE